MAGRSASLLPDRHGDLAERTLRLLFVATLPEPGGACTHLVSLVHALIRRGHQVTVLASTGPGVWELLGTPVGLTRVAGTFRRAFDKDAMRQLDALLSAEAFDYVFAVFEQDYWGALRVARAHQRPVALFLHHAGMKRTNRLLLPFARPTYLVPSDDLRDWICARRIPRRRVHVLPNPIDTDHFRADAARRGSTRAALGFTDQDVVVGFVGRLEYNKGVLPFAEALNAAMSRDARVRALWVGSGRREADVDALIARADDPSRHVRVPWARDVRAYYDAMDVFALPSTGRESFGRVLAEAQCHNLAVLGSAIGGIPMAIKPAETGLVVPPGDVRAWTDAIVHLVTDDAQRAAFGRAGRPFVCAQFDSGHVASTLARFVLDHTS
jgi:glycosyltransferase involved in cell wall biosynthesis